MISTLPISWDVKECCNGWNKQWFQLRWMLFAVLSLLFHAFILKWLGDPKVNLEFSEENKHSLAIRIESTQSKHQNTQQQSTDQTIEEDVPVTKQSLQIADQTENERQVDSGLDKIRPVEIPKPGLKSKTSLKKPAVERNSKMPSAVKLLETTRQMIPEITQELEEQESLVKEYEVFDPGFRKQLEAVRREKLRREEAEHINRRQLSIEIIGEYEDYLSVRIGKKCWRVPMDTGAISEPYDTRIWMAELNCPDGNSIDFSRPPSVIDR